MLLSLCVSIQHEKWCSSKCVHKFGVFYHLPPLRGAVFSSCTKPLYYTVQVANSDHVNIWIWCNLKYTNTFGLKPDLNSLYCSSLITVAISSMCKPVKEKCVSTVTDLLKQHNLYQSSHLTALQHFNITVNSLAPCSSQDSVQPNSSSSIERAIDQSIIHLHWIFFLSFFFNSLFYLWSHMRCHI